MAPSRGDQKRRITTTMIHNGASGRHGLSKPAILGGLPRGKDQLYLFYVFAKLWGAGLFAVLTMQIAVCYAITLWHSIPIWRSKDIETMSLGEWVMEVEPSGHVARWLGLDVAWRDFVETMLLPLMSAMTTATEEDVLSHPVEEILGEQAFLSA